MILRRFIMILGNFFFIAGISLLIFTYSPIVYSEVKYAFSDKQGSQDDLSPSKNNGQEPSDDYTISQYDPKDKNFSVIIPKIDVNAPVVKNVTMVNEKEYMGALRKGVAHAIGTPLPGEKGNIFLFAHSSINFWQLGPYATVFNLLNKLEKKDGVVLFYEGKYYEYIVTDNYIVPGWDTTPFNEEYDESVVTLVTCDPPGTTINRRIVKAKLLTVLN